MRFAVAQMGMIVMIETRTPAIARLDQKLLDIDQRLSGVEDTLKSLVALSNEWAGVRKALLGSAAILTAASTAIGVVVGYLKVGPK